MVLFYLFFSWGKEITFFISLKKISTRWTYKPSRMYKKVKVTKCRTPLGERNTRERNTKVRNNHTQEGRNSPTKEAKCMTPFLAS